MMEKKKQMNPRIRFKGFEDNWEQRKLSSLVTQLTGNDGRIDLPILTISASRGWMNQSERFSKVIAGNELKKYTLLKRGDLSYNHGNSKVAPYGAVFMLGDRTEALVPRVYHSFRTNSKASGLFIQYLFETGLPNRELRKLVTSGARMDGLLNINSKSFFGIEVKAPNLDEQSKGQMILENIDKLIAANEKKVGQLKLQKKLLLQKLFSVGWRFKGFKDPWEQRKLGELANIVRGASPRPIQDPKWFDVNSNIGWLRISDVSQQDGRIHHLEQRLSKIGMEKTRIVNDPHLLLSIAATVGKPVINYVPTGVHDGFLIFEGPKFDIIFMFNWLNYIRDTWKKFGQPGSQLNLNSEIVKNKEILLPSINEQLLIGKICQQCDSLIAANEEKVEQLKQVKKFLMQNLFV